MTAHILDGRTVASHLWRDLSDRVAALRLETDAAPRLAIIAFDPAGAPAVYAASLSRAARSIGVEPVDVRPPTGSALSDVAARIGALNRDPQVAGIVIAQPLPSPLVLADVVALIDPAKDVDGATPANAERVAAGDLRAFVPATAAAVMTMLRVNDIDIAGRRAVVIGRSAVVGRPVASLLVGSDATVEICHRQTRNLARETRRAEILVVAAGVPRLVRSEMVNRSAVVIDCGINVTPQGLVGDVDFETVRRVVRAITPVPGGIGPVTTMTLLEQTVRAAEALAGARLDEASRFSVPQPSSETA